jgi:methylated-DNA-[protein]-cysteine S-methyltransferase
MKLLQESPVEFLEPLSRPPDIVYITEIRGGFGSAVLAGTSQGILRLKLDIPLRLFASQIQSDWDATVLSDSGPFDGVRESLKGYLEGEPAPVRAAVQPVVIKPFTLAVHRILTRIPFGETCLYGEIARQMEMPGAARAVGGACGRNQVLVIVPCHRVLAAGGLGGFGAGLDIKKRLLRHENIDF